jgi:3-keto-disaccharide hydrolase
MTKFLLALAIPFAFLGAIDAQTGKADRTDLLADKLAAWKEPHGDWQEVGDVEIDPKNPRKFIAKEGRGVWYNGPKGNAKNLFTKQKFADVEIHLEFNIPKGSNSGIKFHSHYEVQILDSFGKKQLTGDDCGGIYPRADVIKGRYTHLDKGIAPKVNACKAPGEWQTLDVTFLAPRFDKDGTKIKNAQIASAKLNGQVIHENQELLTPTGDRWKNKEMSEGALMFQADHGPVAIRNMSVRVLK